MAFSSEFKTKTQKNFPYTMLPVTEKSSKGSTRTAKTILPIITTLFLVILLSCSIFIIMALWLAPQAPVVKLNSLSVTNFTVSNTKLAANWVANFTVCNPSLAMKLSLDSIVSAVLYQENNALAIASVEGFEMDSRGENSVQMEFSTTGYEGDQPIVEYPVLREIEEDKKRRGTVRFSMIMNMRTTYKSAGYNRVAWTKRFVMNSYCLGLNVGVVKGNGSFIGGGSRRCEVILMLADDHE
ncbi:hypothetical protein Ddye_008465 [Dipteronia dyeriana]|uniref:Late embryogenesis abundant protein LEA-2 subgroup domain-containing protein n=1 Tax=Dipteronia dyeriana TaxID=168575 RepID=A0AAD9X9U8_9ROSI|nr:hypothetical protein Ddye_008465 [Dipteronia dyeriana]